MKKNASRALLVAAVCGMLLVAAEAGAQAPSHSEMPAMTDSQTPGMDHSQMPGMADSGNRGENEMGATVHSMSNRHMDMGPHMKMTELRPERPGDRQRADAIVRELRTSIEKYKDVHVAEDDGYKEFLPNVPSGMKHFTNWHYAMEAVFHFNPEHPTSLLYEKHGNTYKLIGAMYTAPKRFTDEDLDKRIPLSVAQWHEHVNLCAPPKGEEREMFLPGAQFGLAGSITSRQECSAAGGRFYPVVFNWMVHVYPFEENPAEVWSVERQMAGHRHVD